MIAAFVVFTFGIISGILLGVLLTVIAFDRNDREGRQY